MPPTNSDGTVDDSHDETKRAAKALQQRGVDGKSLSMAGSADGFAIWWQKTLAQHTAVVAEASALVRAHRKTNPASRSRPEQAH